MLYLVHQLLGIPQLGQFSLHFDHVSISVLSVINEFPRHRSKSYSYLLNLCIQNTIESYTDLEKWQPQISRFSSNGNILKIPGPMRKFTDYVWIPQNWYGLVSHQTAFGYPQNIITIFYSWVYLVSWSSFWFSGFRGADW